MKVKKVELAKKFTDIPNVGPRVEGDFRKLGFKNPLELKNQDPLKLYNKLCKITNSRQDPCVLDVFIAVTYFANGKEARPWWKYTIERKKKYPKI